MAIFQATPYEETGIQRNRLTNIDPFYYVVHSENGKIIVTSSIQRPGQTWGEPQLGVIDTALSYSAFGVCVENGDHDKAKMELLAEIENRNLSF